MINETPCHGGCFAASHHDIIIFDIERGHAYKEFTLKAEPKTAKELQNLQKVNQERV